jgi:hypothetical protein
MGLTAYTLAYGLGPSGGHPTKLRNPGVLIKLRNYERSPVITAPVTMVTFSGGIPYTGNTSSSLGRICLPGQPHLKFRGQTPGLEGAFPDNHT